MVAYAAEAVTAERSHIEQRPLVSGFSGQAVFMLSKVPGKCSKGKDLSPFCGPVDKGNKRCYPTGGVGSPVYNRKNEITKWGVQL